MQMLNDWLRTVMTAERLDGQLAEALDEVERLRGETARLQTKIAAVRLVVASQAETGHLDRADVIAALDVEP